MALQHKRIIIKKKTESNQDNILVQITKRLDHSLLTYNSFVQKIMCVIIFILPKLVLKLCFLSREVTFLIAQVVVNLVNQIRTLLLVIKLNYCLKVLKLMIPRLW